MVKLENEKEANQDLEKDERYQRIKEEFRRRISEMELEIQEKRAEKEYHQRMEKHIRKLPNKRFLPLWNPVLLLVIGGIFIIIASQLAPIEAIWLTLFTGIGITVTQVLLHRKFQIKPNEVKLPEGLSYDCCSLCTPEVRCKCGSRTFKVCPEVYNNGRPIEPLQLECSECQEIYDFPLSSELMEED